MNLSPQLIGLLSDQLYRSPTKAIEELVVNGYDAGASETRIYLPNSTSPAVIAVFDDGVGMTYEGLVDLWDVGRRKKRDAQLEKLKKRRQIGKFGIGKLATYAVGTRVTYITKTPGHRLAVTVDFNRFDPSQSASPTPVSLNVINVPAIDVLFGNPVFSQAVNGMGVHRDTLGQRESWTIVILEELKDKAQTMSVGRLKWVISTAMPLGTPFEAYLKKTRIESSKSSYEGVVSFKVSELPPRRLKAVRKKTNRNRTINGDRLTCDAFPAGISGTATVTEESLVGKSSDLARSEGFFVYVRGRLLNEEDTRFGLHELSHATLNRFRATVNIDDLDAIFTANRESTEDVQLYRDAQVVLNEVFNEARQRYSEWEKAKTGEDLATREHERNWVPQRLVEYPIADALATHAGSPSGTEPDGSWMYLEIDADDDIDELARQLYGIDKRERPYKYQYSASGPSDRMVAFAPAASSFILNQDHELVRAYASDPASERLLLDLATAEALLEVYLREVGVPPNVVGEVLERRDLLLRGLANDRMFSLNALSDYIAESKSDKHHLEIAIVAGARALGIVAGARALGFVAKHVSGSGQPDGVARFTDFPTGESTITLEAKSSKDTPSAKDIDFASISVHVNNHAADGCLLVAPAYPGGPDGNSAKSARANKVSCWTIDQFSEIIRKAESRHISARDVLAIVKSRFAPHDVQQAVTALLANPTWEKRGLYLAILRSIRQLHGLLSDAARTVDMVALDVARVPGYEKVKKTDVYEGLREIAGSSKGALRLLDNDHIVLNVDYDELERRVQDLTREPAVPRRKSSFSSTETEDDA